jgi:hypothetical protein
MAIIGRSFDDTLLDTIVTKLRAFSTAQAAIDPATAFFVERDFVRPVPAAKIPFVNVYVSTITPDSQQSGTLTLCTESLTVNFDMIVRGLQTPAATGDDPKSSDQVAGRRLAYLKEQVRYALYQLINVTFGLSGAIKSKKWPRYTANPERALALETQIVDGQWTMDIEYEWKPADSQATALEDLYVTLESDTHRPKVGVHEHYIGVLTGAGSLQNPS